MVKATHAATHQPHVSNIGTRAGGSKQTNESCCRPIDGEVVDGVAQAVEGAAERRTARRKNRLKILTEPSRGRGIDVRAQGVVESTRAGAYARQIIVDAAAGDDPVGFDGAVRTLPGGEVSRSGRQVDGPPLGHDVAGVVQCDCALTEVQGKDGRVACVQVGVDVDVAVRAQGELVGRPGDGAVDNNIAVAAGIRSSGDADIATTQAGRQGGRADARRREGAAARSNSEVHRVDQPGARLSTRGGGGDPSVIGDPYVCRRGFNKAAIPPIRGAGIERAPHHHRACGHVTEQGDGAVAVFQGARLDDAAVVHDSPAQALEPLGGEQDRAARGADGAPIRDLGVEGALIDADPDQAVGHEIHRRRIGRHQCRRATGSVYRPVVHDPGRNQSNVPLRQRAQRSGVGDGAASPIAAQQVAARHEVVRRHRQRRGKQASNIDLRARGEEDAVGIEEEHPAVGREPAKQLRRIHPLHPVERNRARRGLAEGDRGACADVEGLPIDGHPLGALLDGQCGARLADVRRAGNHAGAGGQLRRCGRGSEHDGAAGERKRHHLPRSPLAASLGVFRNGRPGTGSFIPERTIDFVHGGLTQWVATCPAA